MKKLLVTFLLLLLSPLAQAGQPPTTSEELLTQLADTLEAGDIEAALALMPGDKNRKSLESLTPERRKALAGFFRHSKQVRAEQNTRTYEGSLTGPNGQTMTTTFGTVQLEGGHWVILWW